MRRTTVAIALSLAMAACSSGGAGAAATGPAKTGPAETSPTSSGIASTPLDGTWAIEKVTAAEALAALRAHGFGRHELGIFLDEVGALEWFGLTLKFASPDYTLFGSADGGELVPWDYGSSFTVESDILTLVYSAPGGTTTFRWTIEGDRLEFELLEDTQPDYLGLETDVWVAALFTSERFVRVEP
jgi:hypothetical protein